MMLRLSIGILCLLANNSISSGKVRWPLIGKVTKNGQEHVIGNGDFGTITKTLRETLLNIQYEKMDDPFNWVFPI